MPIPLEQFVDLLRAEMASWSTIEVRTHEEGENFLTSRGDPITDYDYHYIDAKNGHRYLDEVHTTKGGSMQRLTHYNDGDKCARVAYDTSNEHQARIWIKPDFATEKEITRSIMPGPFRYFFVEKTPLYEALSRAERLGPATVLDRPCERFLFTNLNVTKAPVDEVYFLDEQTGVPLRVEIYRAGTDRKQEDMAGFWEAKSLDEVQGGRHLPLASTAKTYHSRGEHKGDLWLQREINVTQIRYDHKFPASTFWPKFEPGVQIINSLHNKKTTWTPGPKREVHILGTTKVPVEPPPPVEQPRDWMTFLPVVVAVAGLGFLASAVILKRSRG